MRPPSDRAAFFGLACLAVGLGGGVAVGQSSPPGTPGPTPTPFPPGAVVLQGTITGTNAGVAQELPRTDYDGYVAMDLTFVLEEHRGRATGTADVWVLTGDCSYSDSAERSHDGGLAARAGPDLRITGGAAGVRLGPGLHGGPALRGAADDRDVPERRRPEAAGKAAPAGIPLAMSTTRSRRCGWTSSAARSWRC